MPCGLVLEIQTFQDYLELPCPDLSDTVCVTKSENVFILITEDVTIRNNEKTVCQHETIKEFSQESLMLLNSEKTYLYVYFLAKLAILVNLPGS